MSITGQRNEPKKSPKTSTAPRRLLSGAEVKTRLHERGETLKSWASRHKFSYGTVSDVVRGKNLATYGAGHRIAVALGMKEGN